MKNFSLIFLITLFISCSTDKENPSCGCGGKIESTVPNENISEVPIEDQKSGLIYFNDEDIEDQYVPDDRWDNRFWIFQGTQGCNNCQRKFIVCNESILGSEFDFLKDKDDSIAVKFEGNLMIPCGDNPFIAPADFFYREIVLTSIEKIN